jgi:hypothetical protein
MRLASFRDISPRALWPANRAPLSRKYPTRARHAQSATAAEGRVRRDTNRRAYGASWACCGTDSHWVISVSIPFARKNLRGGTWASHASQVLQRFSPLRFLPVQHDLHRGLRRNPDLVRPVVEYRPPAALPGIGGCGHSRLRAAGRDRRQSGISGRPGSGSIGVASSIAMGIAIQFSIVLDRLSTDPLERVRFRCWSLYFGLCCCGRSQFSTSPANIAVLV